MANAMHLLTVLDYGAPLEDSALHMNTICFQRLDSAFTMQHLADDTAARLAEANKNNRERNRGPVKAVPVHGILAHAT